MSTRGEVYTPRLEVMSHARALYSETSFQKKPETGSSSCGSAGYEPD